MQGLNSLTKSVATKYSDSYSMLMIGAIGMYARGIRVIR